MTKNELLDRFDPFGEHTPIERAIIRGEKVRVGSAVRVWPQKGNDILDLALEGKQGTVQAIEQDYENRIYFAVTMDDDPGKDLGDERKTAHRFFFRAEEIELIG